MSQEKKQETQNAEDNPDVISMLNDFNTKNEGSLEPEEKGSEAETEGVTKKEVEESASETSSEEEATNWLIENKFKDDKEGREALAKGYREIQSRATKAEKSLEALHGKEKEFETLAQLDSFLRSNPEAVKALQSVIQKDKEKIKPPPKPDDYDILDESIEGSSSHKWRQEYDQYLIHRGALEATKEIEAFKQELNEKEEQRRFKRELKELGLSNSEIKEFNTFMGDPKYRNTKTLVDIWRFLTGKASQTKTESKPKVKKDKRTTAAAVPGSVPTPPKPEEKEKKKVWDGIMQFSH